MAIHTKQMTKQIIDWLVDKDYEVEDVSYGNDLCDSLIVNGRVHIMLPNSFIDDESNELFNSFVVKKDEEQEGEVAHSVDQVLELINKNMREEIDTYLVMDVYRLLGIDRPSNHVAIIDFIEKDIKETADKSNWHSGDVCTAFRRFLESKTEEV